MVDQEIGYGISEDQQNLLIQESTTEQSVDPETDALNLMNWDNTIKQSADPETDVPMKPVEQDPSMVDANIAAPKEEESDLDLFLKKLEKKKAEKQHE